MPLHRQLAPMSVEKKAKKLIAKKMDDVGLSFMNSPIQKYLSFRDTHDH